LQAAVGNLFRDKIGGMEAITFIQTRQKVQEQAFNYIQEKLAEYEIETRGVYIQDVVYPEQLVTVLTQREVAHQEVETFKMQRQSQDQRIETEKARGTADMQVDLARSKVGVDIQTNKTEARIKEAQGEATYIEQTGTAKGAEVRAVGLANAEAYQRQVEALGKGPTTLVNAIKALAAGDATFVPKILVMGSGSSQGVLESLGSMLMDKLDTIAADPTTASSTTGKRKQDPSAGSSKA
jgi:hypothetical protein